MKARLLATLAAACLLASSCEQEIPNSSTGKDAASSERVPNAASSERGEADTAARICLIRLELEDGRTEHLAGFLLGPDRLLVPAEGLLNATAAYAMPNCCDERDASRVIAYDIARNAVVLGFEPPIDLEPIHTQRVDLTVGEELTLAERLQIEFEGGSAVAFSHAWLVSNEDWAVLGRTPRFKTSGSGFGYGSMVLDAEGRPAAMLTGYAGHTRKFGVWLHDIPDFTDQTPIAIAEFRIGRLSLPDRALVEAWKSSTLRHEGRLEAARNAAIESVTLDPLSWLGHYQIGVLADMMDGDLAAAEASLQTSIDAEPKWGEAHYSLGIVLLRQDRFAEAIGPLRKAAEIDPDYPRALGMLGLALWEAEGPEAGLDWIVAACDAGPDEYNHLNNLRNLLAELNRESEVIDRYSAYVGRNPDDLDATRAFVLLLIQARRYQEAVAPLERLVHEDPRPATKRFLAECLIRAGQLDRARDLIDEISFEEPSLPALPTLRKMLDDAAGE
jgi:tetratricopeptide (TPR) repeat protein